MENNEELPEIQKKLINGVEITNLDLAKIAMICDYLVLDRFHDISSFIRLERCFGPFFIKESPQFLVDVFKEICGQKKKYISFGRLILAYTKWKSNSSSNENFNKFMNLVFGDMIKTQDEVIGKLVEGGRIFSTRNTRGRKVISRFSVLTDETKNKLQGFHIQYDDVFDTILSPQKKRDNITLEINFPPASRNIRDRDGISHIGGKYSITKGIIKFLIFKCRSGKTFYIGDISEEDGEQFEFFLFGTSSCQLKSARVELVNEQLIYFEPKFQPSLRINSKIIDFDSLDEKYINDNIINAPLIFEENEMQNIPIEQLEETNSLIIPCISDDAFVDKKLLTEPLEGKNFNEIYKTFLIAQSEQLDEEKENLKKKLYEKTIMRKHLLKVYFNKFKVKENILVLKTKKPEEHRVNMDKFLCKIKAYKNKMNKKIEQKKLELATIQEEDEDFWDDEEDWVDEIKYESEENIPEEREKLQEAQIEKETENKEESKINIENNNTNNEKEEENIIEIKIESPILEENEKDKIKNEVNKEEKNNNNIEGTKNEDLKVQPIEEEKILIEVTNEKKEDLEEEEEKIILKANKPKKLIKKSLIKKEETQNENQEVEIKMEEMNHEEPKKEEIKTENQQTIENSKKEDIKVEEQLKKEEQKKEIKIEEPKKEELKIDLNIKENKKQVNVENNDVKNNVKQNNNIQDGEVPKKADVPKKKKWFCITF